METQRLPTISAYDNTDPRQLRVNPNLPLPSSFPQAQDTVISPATKGVNGLARTDSKRRRASGSGPAPQQSPIENFTQPPAAPEVPKAPPVSYRPPPNATKYDRPTNGYPASFAERAAALTGKPLPSSLTDTQPDPVPQPAKPIRRGSLNRPIGGVYSEIQQHKRDSYPSSNSPVSPRRFSNPISPRQPQVLDPYRSSRCEDFSPPQHSNSAASPPAQASTRRTSAGAVPPPNKEWAPDRSPLQQLEVKLTDKSKEEKRARVQEAERRLRESRVGDDRRRSRQAGDTVINRSQSRQIAADSIVTKAERLSDQSPDSLDKPYIQKPTPAAQYPVLNPDNSRAGRADGSAKRRVSLPADAYQSRPPNSDSGSRVDSGVQDPSRRLSARRAEALRVEQQPERGVRFEGEGDIVSPVGHAAMSTEADPRSRRRSSVTETLDVPHQGREAKPDKLRHDQSPTAKRPSTRDVPVEQRTIYGEKAQRSHNHASAATYGGAPDPVPREAVKGQGQIPKYEIPPQTAAGIQARQVVGFGSEPQGVFETPKHRKHHLSDILHRGHNHAAEAYEQSGDRPRNLDEWRRAGTARLTTADFANNNDTEQDEKAWWEGRSGNRRKAKRSGQGTNTDREYQDDAGKSPLLFTAQFRQLAGVKTQSAIDRVIHTRPYRTHELDAEQDNSVVPPVESHALHFWHGARQNDTPRLSLAYSYSCPNLAIHNPEHDEHFCEPYVSPELTESMRGIRIRPAPATDIFNPPLYLKSGPMIRYTGLKRDRLQATTRSGGTSSSERETWRGSVMIVTADADSSYDPVPTLRLFPEPMDLVPPPAPHRIDPEDTHDLPSEILDPIAGLPKLSRSGKTVYVKPVDDLDPCKDLSRVEDDDGLFEETRTAAVPTAYGTPDFKPQRSLSTSSGNPKPPRRESRPSRKGQMVKGVRLHAERGVTFWRFNLEVELGTQQARVAYSINGCPAIGFWVPARGHSMNVMFHSCNGFSMSVDPNDFSGPDPLWRDVLNSHQSRPFHVMIGGGDQIYNDAVMSQSPQFREWLYIKDPHHKQKAEFTSSMKEELETFYLERYSMWFSQGLFGMANSQIPMVNMWDDHDIIDGFGSYPHHFMSSSVFCGLGAIAFKYYMLFQHQSVPDEGPEDEPSWLMGAAPGPYINELSRSIFVSLGKNMALLALDCRTERMREEILSEASYEMIFDRCRREIIEGETKHLVVLLGVPIAYPRLVWLENLLTSRVMDPVKALGRTGMLGGFLNKFDGGVEILDDLDDHWTAKNHKQERNWFIQELQEFAAEKSVRVTILGGDVHLAAVGQFYSNPKLRVRKDRDHRYMVNVVSSAIVNTPPPSNMADILNKRNKTHHLDPDTDESMIPMFTHDVNGNSRNNRHLLPRRNWCSIREYHPGSTPPPTPPHSDSDTESEDDASPPPRRNSLQRTLSLTRGDIRPGNIIRRLSGRGPAPDSATPSPPDSPHHDGHIPRPGNLPQRASTINNGQRNSSAPLPNSSAPLPRPGNFHRRPTNISEKAAKKGDIDDLADHINLEHGLDIVLNCEIDQKNPAGITTPYRLLVPALYYEGEGDVNTAPYRKKSIISRIGSIRDRHRNNLANNQGQGSWGQEESRTPSDFSEDDEDYESENEPVRPRRWSFGISQRRQYRDQTPPSEREHGVEREIGELGTQQQRMNEHRSQQIGGKRFELPFKQRMAGGLFGRREAPQTPSVGGDGEDEMDYHSHLESSPPGAGTGYPGRRPSKVDKLLGVGGVQRSASMGHDQRRDSFGEVHKDAVAGGYDSEGDYSGDEDAGVDGKRLSRGYSGIDAYSESKGKGWKKMLGQRFGGRVG